MTKEKAIKTLEEIIDEGWLISDFEKCTAIDACEMAIEALEKEPCEDAISRQAVLDLVNSDWKYEGLETDVASLPPVTPQSKTGHWIEEIDDYGEVIGWHCDKCYEDSGFTTDCKWNHCPNCGAKMVN